LYIYDLNKKQTSKITDDKDNEGSAAWRPDGKKIGYLLQSQVQINSGNEL
jgi:Tol biopolymer transport system component